MENMHINHNSYKFEDSIIDMTTINGKDISSMSLKELKKYRLELEIRIGIQKGLADIKAGRVYTEEEAIKYLKKCIRS